MNDTETEDQDKELVIEYELDAPPEKVWRAISIPAFREKWLPGNELANSEPVSSVGDKEIRYKIRDDEPPFLESFVTFQIRPNAIGGTVLTIVHELTDTRLALYCPVAANDDTPYLMLAA